MTGLRRDVASRPLVDLLLRVVAIGVLAVLIFVVFPAVVAGAG